MNIVDGVILAFLAFMGYMGYRKGLLRSLMGLGSYLVAALCARWLSPRFAGWIKENTGLDERVEQSLRNRIQDSEYGFMLNMQLPDNTADLLERHPEMQSAMEHNPMLKMALSDNGFFQGGQPFMAMMSNAAITILAAVLIFAAVKILIHFILRMLDGGSGRPSLLQFTNRMGGAVFNMASGLIVIGLIVVVSGSLAIQPDSGGIMESWQNSSIVNWIYETVGRLYT